MSDNSSDGRQSSTRVSEDSIRSTTPPPAYGEISSTTAITEIPSALPVPDRDETIEAPQHLQPSQPALNYEPELNTTTIPVRPATPVAIARKYQPSIHEDTIPPRTQPIPGSPDIETASTAKNRGCKRLVNKKIIGFSVFGIIFAGVVAIIVYFVNKSARNRPFVPNNLYGELIQCRITPYSSTLPQNRNKNSIKGISKSLGTLINSQTVPNRTKTFLPYTDQCEHHLESTYLQPLAYSPHPKYPAPAPGPFQIKLHRDYKRNHLPTYLQRLTTFEKDSEIPLRRFPMPPPLAPKLLTTDSKITETKATIFCLTSGLASENPSISRLNQQRKWAEEERQREQERREREALKQALGDEYAALYAAVMFPSTYSAYNTLSGSSSSSDSDSYSSYSYVAPASSPSTPKTDSKPANTDSKPPPKVDSKPLPKVDSKPKARPKPKAKPKPKTDTNPKAPSNPPPKEPPPSYDSLYPSKTPSDAPPSYDSLFPSSKGKLRKRNPHLIKRARSPYHYISDDEYTQHQSHWDSLNAEIQRYTTDHYAWRLMPADGYMWKKDFENGGKKGRNKAGREGWVCWVGRGE